MRTLLLIMFPFMLYAQNIELRKARCMIAATTIPTLVSGGLVMWLGYKGVNDKMAIAIPAVNCVVFFGFSVKAFSDKNRVKKYKKFY